MKKDGVDPARVPYLAKQLARVGSALTWVDGEVAAGALAEGELSVTAVALLTAVEWMRFRDAHPLSGYGAIARLSASLAERASVASSRPVG